MSGGKAPDQKRHENKERHKQRQVTRGNRGLCSPRKRQRQSEKRPCKPRDAGGNPEGRVSNEFSAIYKKSATMLRGGDINTTHAKSGWESAYSSHQNASSEEDHKRFYF